MKIHFVIAAVVVAALQDPVEVKTNKSGGASAKRMTFSTGDATNDVATITVLNAKLTLGSAGYLNVAGGAAPVLAAGDLRYDTTDNILRYYTGSAWKTVATSTSTATTDAVLLQSSTPGTLQTGNWRVSGVGIAETALTVGTNAASAGGMRLPNATWIAARNAANTADVNLLQADAGDLPHFGTGSVVLDPGNDVTIAASNPSAARTYTLADVGANATFVMTEGTQTVNGAKTFSTTVTVSSGAAASLSVTSTGTGTVNTITANSVSTGRALDVSATGLTNGSAVYATGRTSGASMTGALYYGTSYLGNAGKLMYLTGTAANGVAGESAYGAYVDVTNTPTALNSAYGTFSRVTDTTTSLGNTTYGVYGQTSDTAVVGSAVTKTHYAGYFTATKTGASTAGTFNTYGVYAAATGSTEGASTAYGIYATASGADTNWAGYFQGAIRVTGDQTVDGTTTYNSNVVIGDGTGTDALSFNATSGHLSLPTATSATAGRIWYSGGTVQYYDGATRTLVNRDSSETLTNKTMGSSSTWNGNLIGLAYGGTNANLTATAGGVVYSTSTAMAISAAGTSGSGVLLSGGTGAPTWGNTISGSLSTQWGSTTSSTAAGTAAIKGTASGASGSVYGVQGIATASGSGYGGYFDGGSRGIYAQAVVSGTASYYGADLLARTSSTGAGTLYAARTLADASGAANTVNSYGLYSESTSVGDGTGYGGYLYSTTSGTGAGTMYGVYTESYASGAGNTKSVYGLWAQARGGSTNFAGVFVNEDSDTSSLVDTVEFQKRTTGTAANGIGTALLFRVENSAGVSNQACRIGAIWTDVVSGTEDSALVFQTRVNAGALTERMRIQADGTVSIGTTSDNSALLFVSTSGTALQSTSTTTGSANVFTANSVTTGTGLDVSVTGLTSGQGLRVQGPTSGANMTGRLVYATGYLGADGALLEAQGTFASSTVGSFGYGLYVNVTNSAGADADVRGLYSYISDTTTVGADNTAVYGYTIDTGATTVGSEVNYGGYFYCQKTGASTVSCTTYGVRAQALGSTDGTSTAYGIYATASGADTNYAGYFSGNVHITGQVTATAMNLSFRAYNSASDVISVSGYTKVELDTEDHDDGSDFSTVNDRYTVPTTGVYMFSGAVLLDNIASNTQFGLSLFVNGSHEISLCYTEHGAADTSFQGLSGSAVLKLNAGDYVELYVYSSDASYTIYGSGSKYTNFSGFRVY